MAGPGWVRQWPGGVPGWIQLRNCVAYTECSAIVPGIGKGKVAMDIEADVKDLRRQVGDLEGAIGALSGQVGQIVARLDTLNTQVWSLRDDLPLIVQSAVAGALPAAPKRRLD